MAQSKRPKWSDLKKFLKTLDSQDLLAVIKELFDASSENRQFLATQFLQETGMPAPREWHQRIDKVFYTRSGRPLSDLRLAAARKTIRDYRKATGDICGTIDLTLYYVETGTGFTLEYGDIDAGFYSSLSSALNDVYQLLTTDGGQFYPLFRDRLQHLASLSSQIGWGYGDHLAEVFYDLEDP